MAKLDKLITFAYLREEVDIPQNIEDAELEHPIYRAQEILRMLMCDEFYQDFLTHYKANTFSEAYEALYPYVKKFIAWQSYSFWTLKANVKPTRSGFRIHSEANSVAADGPQMGYIISDSKSQANFYKNNFMDYLNGHKSDYPLACNCCGGNLTGNSFQISAVKNKTKQPQPYGTNRGCKSW